MADTNVHYNKLGQPIGPPVPNWTKREHPPKTPMEGQRCIVEYLNPERHAKDLYEAFGHDPEGRNWTYMPYGPFSDFDSFRRWLNEIADKPDPWFHAIIDKKSGRAVGMASYLRIDRDNGVIEVGHIHFSPLIQRTTIATETMYLMMRRAFVELGYRRYEWKCDNHNARSKAAAVRFGFKFEGVFRQDRVIKGFNRDTAWFSVIDSEWPRVKAAFEQWLDPKNFDADGNQKLRLSDLTK